MGYRSDIYIKCKVEKVFEFKQFLQTYKEKFNEDLQQTEKFYIDNHYLYLMLTDWKFYENYPEVQYITDFLNRGDLEEHIGMVAIGEDGATEELASPWKVDLSTYTQVEGM